MQKPSPRHRERIEILLSRGRRNNEFLGEGLFPRTGIFTPDHAIPNRVENNGGNYTLAA